MMLSRNSRNAFWPASSPVLPRDQTTPNMKQHSMCFARMAIAFHAKKSPARAERGPGRHYVSVRDSSKAQYVRRHPRAGHVRRATARIAGHEAVHACEAVASATEPYAPPLLNFCLVAARVKMSFTA